MPAPDPFSEDANVDFLETPTSPGQGSENFSTAAAQRKEFLGGGGAAEQKVRQFVPEDHTTEQERAYQQALQLALDVFNRQLREDRRSLTLADLQAMPQFTMSAHINGPERGQSYKLVLDRDPNAVKKNESTTDPRILVIDRSEKGKRLFPVGKTEHEGTEVFNRAVRIESTRVAVYDSRQNHSIPVLEAVNPSYGGENQPALSAKVTNLLEHARDHPDTVHGGHVRNAPQPERTKPIKSKRGKDEPNLMP